MINLEKNCWEGLSAFKILCGSGEYLFKYAKDLDNPTFEEAKSSLRVAASLLSLHLKQLTLLIRIGFTGKLSITSSMQLE